MSSNNQQQQQQAAAAAAVYGLRAPVGEWSVTANTDRNRFLAGTLDLKRDNAIHLLDFDEEASELISTIYRHPAEIWQLAACPQREDLVATVHGGRFHADMGVTQAATLWKMPGGDGNAGAAAAAAVGVSGASGKSQLGMAARPLESLLTIEAVDAPIRSVLWEPVEGGPSGGSGSGTVSTSRLLLAVDDNAVRVWNVGEAWSTATNPDTITIPGNKAQVKFTSAAAWNPHNLHELSTACSDGSLRGWDLRSPSSSATSRQTFIIDQAHGICTRDVDYNPNRPHHLVTAGDDCRIRFWDLRNAKVALKEVYQHSHWVWSVAYNRFHDQLLLSAGSDAQVILHSVPSLSSAASAGTYAATSSTDGEDEEDDSENVVHGGSNVDVRQHAPAKEKPSDATVAVYEHHEESVYGLAWSAGDPWIFASLSYDGRVVVNMVPSKEKYKIML